VLTAAAAEPVAAAAG